MAERSIIDGFGAGVKKWASEETAKEIASTLKDMHGLSQKQEKLLAKSASKAAGAGGSAPDPKAFRELTDSMAELNNATEESTKLKKKNTEETGKSTIATKTASLAMNIFKASLATVTGSLVYAFGASFGSVIKQANMVAELNASGIQLATNINGTVSGLRSFGQATTDANLSFKELSDISKKYGAVINKYGVQAFAETSRSVTNDLKGLGISSAESSELVAEYLQARRFMTYQEQMTQQQQSRAATQMIKQIDSFSMAFGESRKALMESSTKALEQVDVQSFLKTASKETAIIFEGLSSRFSGAEFGDLQTSLLQAVANPIVQQTEMFQALAKGGATEAMNALAGLNQATRSGNIELAEVKRDQLMSALRNADTELSQLIGAEGQMLRNFVNQSKNHYDLMAKEQSAAGRTDAARIVKMQNAYKNISLFFERVSSEMFQNDDFINAINESMGIITKAFDENGPALAKSLSSVVRVVAPLIAKSLPYIVAIFDKLTEWATGVSKTLDDVNPAEWIAGLDFSSIPWTIAKYVGIAVAGTAAVALIGGAIGAGIATLLSKVAFGGGGKGGGLFGNMFKGVGKGIGGIMQGFANGLAAFGKAGPAVIKGAAIISAVVVLLSGAVALGMAAISLAMPGFAKGLQAFESLDGDNLAKVGDGVMKLGAGLAAMGAGKLLDVFGSIGEAVMGFFTGEKQGPIEMLKMFAGLADEVGPGLLSLGNALSGFIPSLTALVAVASKTQDIDLTKFIDNIKGLSALDLDSANFIMPSVLVNSKVIDTSELQAKIDTALSRMAYQRRETITISYNVDVNSSGADYIELLTGYVDHLNNRLQRLNEVVNPNNVTRIVDAILAEGRTTANSTTLSNLLTQTGITEIPGQIDESANQLSDAIARYMKEFAKLESIKPISASTRVEYSPINNDAKRGDPISKPSYLNVDYTKAPMQVNSSTQQEKTSDITQPIQNPELSKTNVAQGMSKAEPEINSLVKEQNKILGNLVIAMDTSNKRLKSLVRINEEKG